MIRHVVNWKLATTDPVARNADGAEVVRRLSSLLGVVPSIRSLSVGVNSAYPEKNWDVCLVADFDDIAGLEAYQAHPAHVEAGGFVASVVSERACVDFEL